MNIISFLLGAQTVAITSWTEANTADCEAGRSITLHLEAPTSPLLSATITITEEDFAAMTADEINYYDRSIPRDKLPIKEENPGFQKGDAKG